jgi:regulator of sigma E protease
MYMLASLLGQLYHNVVPFVILLGILIFVHELGHFAIARLCGVRVEVFSLGFGKKILQYKKGDTTYCISLIPLGGYVKMFGEQPFRTNEDNQTVELTAEEKKVSFTHKNVWQRIAIVLAGPMMNFFFAVFVFGFIAQIGEESRAPIVASITKDSSAAKMGLSSGDRIVEMGGVAIQSYEDFQKGLNAHQNASVSTVIETISKERKTISLNVSAIKNPNIFSMDNMIGSIEGIEPLARGTTVGIIPNSQAEKLGFKIGDEVVAIADKKISRWDELENFFTEAKTIPNGQATFEVKRGAVEEKNASTIKIEVPLANLKSLTDFGFEFSDLYLDQVVKGSPADMAGLQKFDRIVSIGSQKIEKWDQVLNTIKSFDGKEALDISVMREGTPVMKKITPQVTVQMTALGQEDKRYTIGIMPMVQFAQPEMTVVKSASIFSSIEKGFSRTIDISAMTVFSFVKLFQGEVSHKNIGGMISIGKAAKDSFELGLQSFLMTMGILSVSLFILNLLPIPVLDGGHLVFYGIEAIKGSPLSVKKMEVAQQIGFVLLMGLMVLALFNDFTKFFFKT